VLELVFYIEADIDLKSITNQEFQFQFCDTMGFGSTITRLQNLAFHLSRPSVFSRLTQVRKLKLWIELPLKASPFSVEYKYDGVFGSVRCPPLKEDEAKKAAIGLFKEMRKDPKARIEELELCFVRLDIEDRMQSWPVEWPVCVTRLKNDDRKVKGEVSFKIDYGKGWSGCK
jgi:hypothetical protein